MKILIAIFFSLLTYAEVVSPNQILSIRNEYTGVKEYEYSIAEDSYSIDLSYTMNTNPMKAGDLSGLRTQVTFHRPTFSYIGYFATTNAFMSETTNIIGNFVPEETVISFTEIGLGVSRRSNLISYFLTNKNIYDEITVVGTMTSADSEELTNGLSGFGLVSGYGVFWRTSRRVHIGLRASYHLHTLEDESDPAAIVEYSANWLALDASLGFYF